MQPYRKRPYLGYGLGLRVEHYDTVVNQKPAVDWFEINSENYMVDGGKPLYYLDRVRADYPLVMHGVSLSIGSTDPLNTAYLEQLKNLADYVQPEWISDHLCWTGVEATNLHDLMPLPYSEEAIQHVSERVIRVQDYLGRQILLENVSSYLTYNESIISEWEFLAAIAERADCNILLDINNIHVSAFNHQFDPLHYLDGIPAQRVHQFHLAGHTHYGDYIIDTHDQPVVDEVWALYAQAVQRYGRVSTMIERDDNIPEFAELLAEMNTARAIGEDVLNAKAAV